MLQDSAELYVWTLIKARNLTAKDQTGFVSHIETLQKAGVSVPTAAKQLELNKARVGFKHYGNLPASDEAKMHQTYVEELLRAAMLDHFKILFDELSLVDLVTDGQIKARLKMAEHFVVAGSFREAIDELTKAKNSIF